MRNFGAGQPQVLIQWLPVASSLVIFAFAATVFRRYARRGGTYSLVWGIGLTMFGIANFAEAYSALTWHPLMFRLWYLNGAILTAAWLGQGTVFLLSKRKHLARILFGVLVAGSLAGAYFIFTTPLNPAGFTAHVPLGSQYREIMPPGATVRKLTPFFNIYGVITLVGGALYSAWLLYRKEIAPQRVAGNILIALGGLAIGFASTLVRLGLADYLYVAEFLAAVSMFAGFLLATTRMPAPLPVASPGRVTSS